MKTITTLSMAVVALWISTYAYAAAPEFSNCDRESFSFADLKYYNEKELVEGYCACISSAERNDKAFSLTQQIQIGNVQLYGSSSRQYHDTDVAMDEYSNKRSCQ